MNFIRDLNLESGAVDDHPLHLKSKVGKGAVRPTRGGIFPPLMGITSENERN